MGTAMRGSSLSSGATSRLATRRIDWWRECTLFVPVWPELRMASARLSSQVGARFDFDNFDVTFWRSLVSSCFILSSGVHE